MECSWHGDSAATANGNVAMRNWLEKPANGKRAKRPVVPTVTRSVDALDGRAKMYNRWIWGGS